MVLVHPPDVDVTFVVSCCEEGAVAGDADAGDGDVVFGDELVSALIVTEVPYHDYTSTIGTDEFALVGVDDHIIDRVVMSVVSLDKA